MLDCLIALLRKIAKTNKQMKIVIDYKGRGVFQWHITLWSGVTADEIHFPDN